MYDGKMRIFVLGFTFSGGLGSDEIGRLAHVIGLQLLFECFVRSLRKHGLFFQNRKDP